MRKRAFLITLAVVMTSTMVFGDTVMAGRPGTGTQREADLTGAEVVPATGDADGTGNARLTLYPNKNKICYRIEVSNMDMATAAHLHMGSAGEEGSVVLKLRPPRDGSSRECIRGLGERFIKKVARNSSGYYVDVHNAEFPSGAVRGQLSTP